MQKAPPKIAILMHGLGLGGAERMMFNLAVGMANAGISVDLVLTKAHGHLVPSIPANVRLIDLKGRRVSHTILTLARYLRRERPTTLLAALTHVNITAILASFLAGRRCRIVVSERTTMSQECAETRALSIRAVYVLAPWLYPLANGITAVSQGAAEDLARFCRIPVEKVVVINNPVVGPTLFACAAEPLDHPWFAAGAPPVILSVGRLRPEKDFATLIRAFAELAAHRLVRLMILGEGSERPALEALVDELGLGESVQLPGFSANPYAYMSRAAVLALSSRREGSPNVLVEAMACGTPVVATNCRSGPAELLEDGRLGPLVPVGDHVAMAAALALALDAPVAPDELKRRASMFTVEESTQAYLRLLLGDDSGNKQAT